MQQNMKMKKILNTYIEPTLIVTVSVSVVECSVMNLLGFKLIKKIAINSRSEHEIEIAISYSYVDILKK